MHSKNWILCESYITQVDEFIVSQFFERLLIERLEEKSNVLSKKLRPALFGKLKTILCSLHNDANQHALPPRREVSYFLTKKELS